MGSFKDLSAADVKTSRSVLSQLIDRETATQHFISYR